MSGFPYLCHRTMAEVTETERLMNKFPSRDEWRRLWVLLTLAERNNPTDAADDPKGAA